MDFTTYPESWNTEISKSALFLHVQLSHKVCSRFSFFFNMKPKTTVASPNPNTEHLTFHLPLNREGFVLPSTGTLEIFPSAMAPG